MPALPLPLALCVVVSAGKPAIERPTLSGPELIRETTDGRVRIHYTIDGRDAVPAEDVDPPNGIPDAVDWIEEGARRMVEVFVGEDGWHPLVADDGRGGDDRLDVYVRIIDANGYAHSEPAAGGTAAWIEVNPEVASLGHVPYASVAAHEVHHALEVAQAGSFVDPWIAEASAAYAQYLLFDSSLMTLAREALWQLRLAGAARAMDDAGHGDLFEYAGLVWVKFLVDRAGGDRRALGRLWALMGEERGWVAGHARFVREAWGAASLDEAVLEHAVWNWFACARDDGRHYDRTTAGCRLASGPPAQAAGATAAGASDPIGARGAAYVAPAPDCATATLRATVRPAARARFALLAGSRAPVVAEAPAGVGTMLELDGWNDGARPVLVGVNLGAAETSFSWSFATTGSYTLGAPVALALAPASLELDEGATATLAATRAGGGCGDGDPVAGASWRSSDERVATVENGVVTARAAGTAEIVATFGGITSSATRITVIAAPDSGCRLGSRGNRALDLRSLLGSTLAWVWLLLYRRCDVK